MEMWCTDLATFGSDQAVLDEAGLVLWDDTGQLAILAAHCWKMAYLFVSRFLHSVCLSALIASQAANPLSEETILKPPSF